MSFSTPILFLVFNRPETTHIVFETIKKLEPTYLFIAADGPRTGNSSDSENCKMVKDILQDINWKCKVTTLYREYNLGCKTAVSTAITWFFNQVEQGIILEDDVSPDPSFFSYCEELLNYYRHDETVMHIAGFNVCGTWKESKQSYHGSYFGGVWGWASWRRAWKYYDVNIKAWEDIKIQNSVINKYFPVELQKSRRQLYDNLFEGSIDTWDYQWTLCKLINNGLSIIPSKNLVQNIGFNLNSTHTSEAPNWARKKVYSIELPLLKIKFIKQDKEFDKYHLRLTSNVKKSLSFYSLVKMVKNF